LVWATEVWASGWAEKLIQVHYCRPTEKVGETHQHYAGFFFMGISTVYTEKTMVATVQPKFEDRVVFVSHRMWEELGGYRDQNNRVKIVKYSEFSLNIFAQVSKFT
jgi:hypothetical protein